jgi:phage baseplate assembly protein W
VAIKLKNLNKLSQDIAQKQYLFKDLHLDINFEDEKTYKSSENFYHTNDIQADFDLAAIFNSIRNLFNTRPGQRFLFPKYGLDLNSFLFEPVTEENAEAIASYMLQSITDYEPRVKVIDIQVLASPDELQYSISLTLGFPIFDTVESMNAILNTKTQNLVFINNLHTQV